MINGRPSGWVFGCFRTTALRKLSRSCISSSSRSKAVSITTYVTQCIIDIHTLIRNAYPNEHWPRERDNWSLWSCKCAEVDTCSYYWMIYMFRGCSFAYLGNYLWNICPSVNFLPTTFWKAYTTSRSRGDGFVCTFSGVTMSKCSGKLVLTYTSSWTPITSTSLIPGLE